MANIESYVVNFINSLNLPEELANVLLKSKSDCNLFFNEFYLKNSLILDDLLDFREYKISKSDKSAKSFVDDCNSRNLKDVFEETFYQRFTDDDISHIQALINSNELSLYNLFVNFKSNINKNILKYVL